MVWTLTNVTVRRESPVFAENIVASSQPLATQAGIKILQNGGNAVDAALAAAIVLTVVEPTGNGLGSDAVVILADDEQIIAINGTGHSPSGWTEERFQNKKAMPLFGWDSVTVPGAVKTMVAIIRAIWIEYLLMNFLKTL